MKRKDEFEEAFIECMESIGYDVPDEVTELDAIEMSLAHWRNNLESMKYAHGHVLTTAKYCGLCQYFEHGGCIDHCSLDRFEKLNPQYKHTWRNGQDCGWDEHWVRRMIEVLEKTRDWVKNGGGEDGC